MSESNIHTIQKLINQHKVILNRLLIKLPKIPLAKSDEPVQKLEHKRCIGIAFRHSHQIDILVLHMAEGCRAEREDRGAHLGIGDDLYAEDICKSRPDTQTVSD